MQCQNLASFPASDLPEVNWREIFLQIHVFTSPFDTFHFLSDISDTCSAWYILYPREHFLQNSCLEDHKYLIRTCGLSCLTERQFNPEPHSKLKPECKTAKKSITVILPLLRLLSQRDSWSEGNCILELQMDFSASIYPSIHHFWNSFVLLVSKVFCDNENHNLLNNNILSTILRFCMLTLLPDNFLKGLIVFMSLEIINKHSLFILFKPFTIL